MVLYLRAIQPDIFRLRVWHWSHLLQYWIVHSQCRYAVREVERFHWSLPGSEAKSPVEIRGWEYPKPATECDGAQVAAANRHLGTQKSHTLYWAWRRFWHTRRHLLRHSNAVHSILLWSGERKMQNVSMTVYIIIIHNSFTPFIIINSFWFYLIFFAFLFCAVQKCKTCGRRWLRGDATFRWCYTADTDT